MSPPYRLMNQPLSADELAQISDQADERLQIETETSQRRDRLKHPITKTLRDTQAGCIPSGLELDRLQLSTNDRARVEKAISKLTELRERGEHGAAHDSYVDSALEIIDRLPESQRAASYLNVDEIDDRSPDELAEAVSKW